MKYEIQNGSVGLIEAFKKEPTPITATAGRGSQPPRIRTAVAMDEPEESRTPVPFPFWEALEHNGPLRKRRDTTYEEADERFFFRLFGQLEPHQLPGLDEVLEKYWINEPLEPVTREKSDAFLLTLYDSGLIKPQNWRQRIIQPVKFAFKKLQRDKSS